MQKEQKKFTSIFPPFVEKIFIKLREGTRYLDYGRDIVKDMAVGHILRNRLQTARILDIGAGSGTDLVNIRHSSPVQVELFGVESNEKNMEELGRQGIIGSCISIEKEPLPFADRFFDVVVANQVVEHIKDVFFHVFRNIKGLETRSDCGCRLS